MSAPKKPPQASLPETLPALLTAAETCALLRMTRPALDTAYCRRRPNLPARVKVAGRWLYPSASVLAVMRGEGAAHG